MMHSINFDQRYTTTSQMNKFSLTKILNQAFDLQASSTENALKASQPDNLLKRTGTFVSLVSKALNNSSNTEPAYLRARNEAEEADRTYRVAVRRLDRQRLGLEERIEEVLKLLQRWETERLRAVKTGKVFGFQRQLHL